MEALASLSGVHKRYGRTEALRGIDLAIAAGEVVALLGANGAGKTTAVGMLCGLRSPDAGGARLFGADPRSRAARAGLGVMLQVAAVPDTLSVAELVRQQAACYPRPRPVEEALRLAGLAGLAERRYGKLSGGQKRRVQFAMAICGNPRLLLVDEPTTGLDSEARRAFWEVLRGLVGQGTGVLLTTHYLEEADALADRIVVLHQGCIVDSGTPAQVKRHVAGKRVHCRSVLSPERVAAWDGVIEAAGSGGRLELRTATPEAVLRRLLAEDPTLDELEVRAASLDEAMSALTREAA